MGNYKQRSARFAELADAIKDFVLKIGVPTDSSLVNDLDV